MNEGAILAADASRPAALLIACIHWVCALLAPGRLGASTPRIGTFIHFQALTTRIARGRTLITSVPDISKTSPSR